MELVLEYVLERACRGLVKGSVAPREEEKLVKSVWHSKSQKDHISFALWIHRVGIQADLVGHDSSYLSRSNGDEWTRFDFGWWG